MDPFNSKKFKTLKKLWEKKLEDSGFEDIENTDGSLKASVDPRTIAYALRDKEERETYYTIARNILETHQFETEQDRLIWSAHCEGSSARSIAAKMKITPYRVEVTIIKLRKIAKLKRTA